MQNNNKDEWYCSECGLAVACWRWSVRLTNDRRFSDKSKGGTALTMNDLYGNYPQSFSMEIIFVGILEPYNNNFLL